MTRYRGLSGRLSSSAAADGAEPETRHESLERNPALIVWVPSVRAPRSRPVPILARVEDGEADRGRSEIERIEVLVTPLEESAAGDGWRAMEAAPPSSGAQFRHLFRPPPHSPQARGSGRETRPPEGYRYLARASGKGPEPFERSAGGIFYLHDPGATVSASSAHLDLAGSDLLLRLDVNVERAGTYWAYAELWGGAEGSRPIAFARRRLEQLEPGRHPLSLLFGGAVIRDSAVDGPYQVRNVRLKQVDTHPAHEADPLPALPLSAPGRAADFR